MYVSFLNCIKYKLFYIQEEDATSVFFKIRIAYAIVITLNKQS